MFVSQQIAGLNQQQQLGSLVVGNASSFPRGTMQRLVKLEKNNRLKRGYEGLTVVLGHNRRKQI